eukprot:4422553-Karenia_brevis.AAC.1
MKFIWSCQIYARTRRSRSLPGPPATARHGLCIRYRHTYARTRILEELSAGNPRKKVVEELTQKP